MPHVTIALSPWSGQEKATRCKKEKKSNEKKESLLDWRQTAVVKLQCNDFKISFAKQGVNIQKVTNFQFQVKERNFVFYTYLEFLLKTKNIGL